MSLPLVNIFASSYEASTDRAPTFDEMLQHHRETGETLHYISDKIIAKVTTASGAADYICRVTGDSGLVDFINSSLDDNANYNVWRSKMPAATPRAISKYQKEFPCYAPAEVDCEINKIGETLSEGQFLFHGGIWPGGSSDVFETSRPFSTSFCPQIALRNAEQKGKAYNSGRIDLLVLRGLKPRTNVFSFIGADTSFRHENEVLFASGAVLTLRSRRLIRDDYLLDFDFMPPKNLEVYVVEVDIS